MIKATQLDDTIAETERFLKRAKAYRKKVRAGGAEPDCNSEPGRDHAATLRASLDASKALADLRTNKGR